MGTPMTRLNAIAPDWSAALHADTRAQPNPHTEVDANLRRALGGTVPVGLSDPFQRVLQRLRELEARRG
jgi:hypothetical protein